MEDSKAPFDQVNPVEVGPAWLRNPLGTTIPAKLVHADAKGLQIEGMRFLPRHEISSAFFAPREGERGRVIVVGPWPQRIAIWVLTRDEAKRLLKALGLGPERKHLQFRVQSVVSKYASTTVWFIFMCMAAGIWTGVGHAKDDTDIANAIAFNVAVFTTVAAFFWWFLTPVVVVGADGVTIRSVGFGKSKFVSYNDIVRVRHVIRAGPERSGLSDHALLLEVRGDEEIRLDLMRGDRNEDDASGLVERIHQAHEDSLAREVPAFVVSMLDRGEKSLAQWIASLHQIDAAEEVHYRVAPIDREALFATLEDPTKDASLRVGAAIALRTKLDDEGRARLRVSAEASAEPKLRVALEKVADGAEGEELEAVVRDLDAIDRA